MAEGEELEAVERERARRRQAHGQTAPGKTVKETFPEASKGQTRDKVAAAVGLGSGRTYDKAAKVWEAAKKGDGTTKAQKQGVGTLPRPDAGDPSCGILRTCYCQARPRAF